jgi:hypothetical protein
MTVALFKNGAQNVRILQVRFFNGLVPHITFEHVLAGLLLSGEILVKALPESFSLRGQLVLLGSNTIQTNQGEWLDQFRLCQEFPFLVEHTDLVRFETESESLWLARLNHRSGVVAEEALSKIALFTADVVATLYLLPLIGDSWRTNVMNHDYR